MSDITPQIFEITKQSSHYIISPSASSPNRRAYLLYVYHRQDAAWPYIYLCAKPREFVASARRPAMGDNFDIGPGDAEPDSQEWKPMEYNQGTGIASFTFTMPDGNARDLKWMPAKDVMAEGAKSIRAVGTKYKLIDEKEPETPLGVFTPQKGVLSSPADLLQLNVDYGIKFERMALMTFMSFFAGWDAASTQKPVAAVRNFAITGTTMAF